MQKPVSLTCSFHAAGAEGPEAASDEIEEPTTPQVGAACCASALLPGFEFTQSAHYSLYQRPSPAEVRYLRHFFFLLWVLPITRHLQGAVPSITRRSSSMPVGKALSSSPSGRSSLPRDSFSADLDVLVSAAALPHGGCASGSVSCSGAVSTRFQLTCCCTYHTRPDWCV